MRLRNCSATAHRQCLPFGDRHPPTSVPSHARQAASHATGGPHNDTCRCDAHAGLPLPFHHVATSPARISRACRGVRDWSGAARRLRAQGSASQRRSERRRHSADRRNAGLGRRTRGRALRRRKQRRRIGGRGERCQRQSGRRSIRAQSNGRRAQASASQLGRAQRNSNHADG